MDPKILIVECPTCQKKIAWVSEEKYKPFCSERCKLIDLGEWASNSRFIVGEEKPLTDKNPDDDE